jgi:hypothetical protein
LIVCICLKYFVIDFVYGRDNPAVAERMEKIIDLQMDMKFGVLDGRGD